MHYPEKIVFRFSSKQFKTDDGCFFNQINQVSILTAWIKTSAQFESWWLVSKICEDFSIFLGVTKLWISRPWNLRNPHILFFVVFGFFVLLKEEHWDKYKFAFGYKEEKFKRNIYVLIFNNVQLGEQLAVIYSEC